MTKVNQHIIEQLVETQDCEIEQIEFYKDEPYIIDLTFYRYGFKEYPSKLPVILFLKLIKLITLLYIEWD